MYVYFAMYEQFNGQIKIGKSIKPRYRLRNLQTGNPNRLVIYREIYYDDYLDLERMIHAWFGEYRGLGEWFNLSKKQIDEVCRALIKYKVID